MYGASADVFEAELGAQHVVEVEPTAQLKPSVRKARKLLYRRLRVGVQDGRIFVGKFHCLDKQGNIILYDTVEYRQMPTLSSSSAKVDPDPAMEQRSLGLVLIPSHCRTSCHVECFIDEQLSLLSLKDTEEEKQTSLSTQTDGPLDSESQEKII
ncbi:hypothetical protein O6H91_05G053700 [Diphasiastrum complanatum]|uniref:Uncharacterized protein n=1 Tax=Diphasiastrum complanatum TaxID=34168 RepID=A0ACC2DNK4_DIPCM|nr:hypothetical protein O6H91_05G053700 [Diphasiastrum complanatum]